MGIIKKLFNRGRRESEPKIEFQPGAKKLAPAASTPPSSSAPKEAAAPAVTLPRSPARAPRVPLTALHSVLFEGIDPTQFEPMKLYNISSTGVGLISESPIAAPLKDTILFGELAFENRGRHPVIIKVMHTSKGIIGGAFQERSEELREAIEGYFQAELAALAVMKVNPKYHRNEPDGTAHWIHGDQCDLYYVSDGNNVLRFRLTFMGNRFQGGRDSKLQFGQIIECDDSENIPAYKPIDVLSSEEGAPKELMVTALKVLGVIPHLPPEHRAGIETMFKTLP